MERQSNANRGCNLEGQFQRELYLASHKRLQDLPKERVGQETGSESGIVCKLAKAGKSRRKGRLCGEKKTGPAIRLAEIRLIE